MTLELADGRGELFQWDTGRIIEFGEDTVSQAHFTSTEKVIDIPYTVEVKNGKAAIPDELLQVPGKLIVYAWVSDTNGGYTKVLVYFPVFARPKPSDYVYTPTEHAGFDRLRAEIGDLADLTTEAKDTLVAAINEAAASGGADWAQNSSKAKDYIKNRPEYFIDAPTFTCRLRVAEAGEEHYGIYSSESENLSYDVMLWIVGVCHYASDGDKEKLWVKIDGHLFEMNIYYSHDYYNLTYMKNGEEIFVQSWSYYGFLNDGIASINFNNFFDSVGIKEVKDPDFSFYTVKPCPTPSKVSSGYTDFHTYDIEHLVYLNFGEFPNALDKVQIADETFYDVPCISKGESAAKYTAGSYTIAIERYKDSPDSFIWSYSVKIDPDVNDVIFYSKTGIKWETAGGTFEISVVDTGTPDSNGAFTVTLNKTFAEIDAAVKDGKTPIVIMEGALMLPMVIATRDTYMFGATAYSRNFTHYVVMVTPNESMGVEFDVVSAPELESAITELSAKIDASTILQSTTPNSTKKFKITVDDSGTITTMEV